MSELDNDQKLYDDQSTLQHNSSYEEEEVFFGAVSEREIKRAKKLSHRRTECFSMNLTEIENLNDTHESTGSSACAANNKFSDLPILSGEDCHSQLVAMANETDLRESQKNSLSTLENSFAKFSLNSLSLSSHENNDKLYSFHIENKNIDDSDKFSPFVKQMGIKSIAQEVLEDEDSLVLDSEISKGGSTVSENDLQQNEILSKKTELQNSFQFSESNSSNVTTDDFRYDFSPVNSDTKYFSCSSDLRVSYSSNSLNELSKITNDDIIVIKNFNCPDKEANRSHTSLIVPATNICSADMFETAVARTSHDPINAEYDNTFQSVLCNQRAECSLSQDKNCEKILLNIDDVSPSFNINSLEISTDSDFPEQSRLVKPIARYLSKLEVESVINQNLNPKLHQNNDNEQHVQNLDSKLLMQSKFENQIMSDNKIGDLTEFQEAADSLSCNPTFQEVSLKNAAVFNNSSDKMCLDVEPVYSESEFLTDLVETEKQVKELDHSYHNKEVSFDNIAHSFVSHMNSNNVHSDASEQNANWLTPNPSFQEQSLKNPALFNNYNNKMHQDLQSINNESEFLTVLVETEKQVEELHHPYQNIKVSSENINQSFVSDGNINNELLDSNEGTDLVCSSMSVESQSCLNIENDVCSLVKPPHFQSSDSFITENVYIAPKFSDSSIPIEQHTSLHSRVSYFSSLDVINVDREQCLFTEEETSLQFSNSDSPDCKNWDRNHDYLDNHYCNDYQKSKKDELSISKSCSSITLGNSENSTDDGSKNYAAIFSDNSDYLLRSKSCSNIEIGDSLQPTVKPQQFDSPISSIDVSSDNNKVKMDDSFQSLGNPCNDTIEEMELLLKYGDRYFKENKIDVQKVNVCHNISFSNEDETVLSPTKKCSIASADSVFEPNLDSTRASSELFKQSLSDEKKGYREEKLSIPMPLSTEMSCTRLNSKREPPPKPPRYAKAHSPTQINNEVEKVTKSKAEAVTRPTIKVRPRCVTPVKNEQTRMETPASSRPKLYRQISSSSGKVNNNLTPISKNVLHRTLTPTPQNRPSKYNDILHLPSLEHLTAYTPKNLNSNKIKPLPSFSRTVKADRVASKIFQRPFLTPQGKTGIPCATKVCLKKQTSNLLSNQQKVRGLNIVSPVAKYLQDNPPPPLIATVKPRNRPNISPQIIKKMPKPINSCSDRTIDKPGNIFSTATSLNASMMQRDETIQKIGDNMRKLALKINSKTSSSSALSLSKYEEMEKCSGSVKARHILPSSVYIPGKVHTLENKENHDSRREIPSDKPPSSILKHKGRIQIPKKNVLQPLQNNEVGFEQPVLPPGYSNLNNVTTSSRVSLMEVSVYETNSVLHTNTLH